jgi:hypothetical protein
MKYAMLVAPIDSSSIRPCLPQSNVLCCALQRLELVARVQLAHYLELPLSEVPATITEYTTTDIAAACSVAGLKLVQGTKKTVSCIL